MVKLVCIKCGTNWYTSNTQDNQKCEKCGGKLEKVKE